MRFVVLHGSPAGPRSITFQYVRFIQQQFSEHTFEVVHVARQIRRLERDTAAFERVARAMAEADGVLWSFPVYTFLTPAPLVRLVELLVERVGPGGFEGQVATSLSTSAHFYDHTAHQYIAEISADLGMDVLRGFSAEMEDLLEEEERQNLIGFMKTFGRCAAGEIPLEQPFPPVHVTPRTYRPGSVGEATRAGPRRVALITDAGQRDANLRKMIEVFCSASANPVDVVHLDELEMKSGCMGCLRCTYDGQCVIKDGFADGFEERIRTADALIFAGRIRYRYLSSAFKTYFDRNFRNGHRPILHGKPMGFLLSGPLQQLPNLQQILEAKFECQHSYRLGVVTDEYGDDAAITTRVAEMARAIDRWFDDPWERPQTFLGVGGRKIFRDLVYSMRGLVVADHEYYRSEGLYDFPQRDLKKNLFNLVIGASLRFGATRRRTLKDLGRLKLMPFREVLGEDDRP